MEIVAPAYYLAKLWYLLIPFFGPPGLGVAASAGLAWKTPAVHRPAGGLLKGLEVQRRILATRPGEAAELVEIPGGKLKACPEDGEGKCETFEVGSFRMGRTEVTVGRFAQCVKAGKCRSMHYLTLEDSHFCNLGTPGREDHPMNCVAYFAARDYCEWAGGRLPTLREWQFAARGEGDGAYPGGTKNRRATWQPITARKAGVAGNCTACRWTRSPRVRPPSACWA